MRQRQRQLCCDVSVMRSADSWTDHKLLRAQLKVRCPAKKSRVVTRKRYAVRESVLDSVRQFPVRDELDLPPSEEEVLGALNAVRGNKAGGKNGILPELVKCCGANLLEYFLELFHQVWRDECVPQEWKDALIVPIPKKGD